MSLTKCCRVCHQTIGGPLYRSATDVSITSLCEIRRERTEVSYCSGCGHLQTEAIANLETYYDQQYQILIESEDEDQIYAVVNGHKIYRTDHQVSTLLKKVSLIPAARVLDYGCAKSSTLRRLSAVRPDLDLCVFDVSEMYLPFWQKFIPPGNWAVYRPKPEWEGQFDLITSFFALEHVANPEALARDVARLLKPEGIFYCVVPNVYANTADFVVADHVHHFSAPSLRRLLQWTGLSVTEIDRTSHSGAWVLVARKMASNSPLQTNETELRDLTQKVEGMARYWSNFAERVQSFEQSHLDHPTGVIYGSGFYGTFIATCMSDFDRVACFLDQNPHRQKQTLLGKPIRPPECLPDGTSLVYVGLNPRHARESISGIDASRTMAHTYFYP